MDFDAISKKLRLKISKELETIQGGNSSVIKAKLKDDSFIAVKVYKGDSVRIQRMLDREQSAITYLASNGFLNIPEILEVRKDLNLIAYRWIEGVLPIPNTNCMDAIIKMCLALSELDKKLNFESAIDAGFSLGDIERQIRDRIIQFRNESMNQYSKEICLSLEEKLHRYKVIFKKNQNFFPHTLSVSDLGTHNMLYTDKGYRFIDFEFFGRDSVDKMVGDFLLHPRDEFNVNEINRFKEKMTNELGWQSDNLRVILPILALKWAAIAFKRELKIVKKSFGSESEIMDKGTFESIGAKYLEYFEYLISGETVDSAATFNLFTAKI
jgi:hypothetical protein